MDQATAQALIAPVEAATQQAESYAQSASDPTIRGQELSAVRTLRRAVNSWETTQLDEVLSGRKPDSWWTGYGDSLLEQARRYIRDNSEFYSQWSRALLAAGTAALEVQNYVWSNLQSWQDVVNGYRKQLGDFYLQQQTTEQLSQLLWPARDRLPRDLYDALFGAEAQEASNKLSYLTEALDKADAMLQALANGAEAVFVGSDLRLKQDVPALRGTARLGAAPIVVAGGVVAGLIALLTLCGSLVAWLLSYYQHVGQVTQSDAVLLALGAATGALQILNDPNATPEARALAQRVVNAAANIGETLAKQAPPDPFGGLSGTLGKFQSAAATVVTGAIVVGVGYVAWTQRERIIAAFSEIWARLTRKKNPRRRRKKKQLKRLKARRA